MGGIEDPHTIDLLTHDPKTGEYALIMVETRPWDDSPTQLAQLREKINSYAMFALDEALIVKYPEIAGKPLRLQLDSIAPLSEAATQLIAQAAEYLEEHRIRFVVNLLP